jgi:hypothetical protein
MRRATRLFVSILGAVTAALGVAKALIDLLARRP